MSVNSSLTLPLNKLIRISDIIDSISKDAGTYIFYIQGSPDYDGMFIFDNLKNLEDTYISYLRKIKQSEIVPYDEYQDDNTFAMGIIDGYPVSIHITNLTKKEFDNFAYAYRL